MTRRMSSRAPSALGSASSSRSSASLVVAGIERGECLAEIGHRRLCAVARRRLEADPGRQAVGGEAPGDAREHGQRLVGLAASFRILASGTAASARVGSSSFARRSDSSSPRSTSASASDGQQRVEELLDRGRRLSADELGCDRPVAERLDGGDALNPERSRQPWVGVDVDLGQLDLAGAGIDGALDHRPELPAGSAPFRPEVDDHRARCASGRGPLSGRCFRRRPCH